MNRLIECVPNFSEGKDKNIIQQIAGAVASVSGIMLLNVDPGMAANRTVITFAGTPEQVVEAAFRGVKKAAELIDMRLHHGTHPRVGATDVLPLIPLSGVSMEETVEYAHRLAKRIGNELQIPIYCYEEAAFIPQRRNLAFCRIGEYEGLREKLSKPGNEPDFGPCEFNERSGLTVLGARNFLVAYNVNLNTTSVALAKEIAGEIREKGRLKREGGSASGAIVKDNSGNPVRIPGSLKTVKAIGWYIDEYGCAQVSMNLTNINITPVHLAYEEVCRRAEEKGILVTGSELIGLIPLQAMLEAGKYFLERQNRPTDADEKELITVAVQSLGLDNLSPFIPEERIIEYKIRENTGL